MVINSGFILRDQSGQILERGAGCMVLVLSENEGKFKLMEIPYEDEDFTGDIFESDGETLEQLKYHSNLHKLIDRI